MRSFQKCFANKRNSGISTDGRGTEKDLNILFDMRDRLKREVDADMQRLGLSKRRGLKRLVTLSTHKMQTEKALTKTARESLAVE